MQATCLASRISVEGQLPSCIALVPQLLKQISNHIVIQGLYYKTSFLSIFPNQPFHIKSNCLVTFLL